MKQKKWTSGIRMVLFSVLILSAMVLLVKTEQGTAHAARGDEIRFGFQLNPEPVTSNYFFLTNYEVTRFYEFIWFWAADSVVAPFGVRVHSNFDIGVHNGAYFGCLVTTTGSINSPIGSTFAGYPRPGYFEHVRAVHFPSVHTALRNVANEQRSIYPGADGSLTYGLQLDGNVGYLWRWETGTNPPEWNRATSFDSIHWTNESRAIFFDAPLRLKGVFRGRLGIGSSYSIRLMDDVRAEDATAATQWLIPPTSNNYLALVSEAQEFSTYERQVPDVGIIIANTWENGRDNGSVRDSSSRDIVITAQVMALNGSFTFEDQHDAWEATQSTFIPDERGKIFLHGNIVQHRRGYLHRANNGGTGYTKQYKYDERFARQTPPFALRLR